MVIVFRLNARKRREHRVSTIPFNEKNRRNGDCFSSKRDARDANIAFFTIPFNEKKGEMVIVFRLNARKRREYRVSTIPFNEKKGKMVIVFRLNAMQETRASRLYNPIQNAKW